MRRPSRRRLVLTVAALVAAAGAHAAFPPISDPPTEQRLTGKFVWIDLVTSDVPAAQRFYGELLGWTFAQPEGVPQDYVLAYRGGAPVAGLAARPPVAGQARQGRWIAYLSVGNVARTVDLVTYRGGKVLIPRRSVEGRGEMTVLADPDGVPFGLVRSSSGDPPDFQAEPGEWIWAVYQSPDAGSAAAFYQELAGYEVARDDRFGDRPVFTLVADGFARASLVEIPPERPELRAEWLYFVRVADVSESLASARALGGRVHVEPDPSLLEGRLAVIADPTGATLGLMEWDESVPEGH